MFVPFKVLLVLVLLGTLFAFGLCVVLVRDSFRRSRELKRKYDCPEREVSEPDCDP